MEVSFGLLSDCLEKKQDLISFNIKQKMNENLSESVTKWLSGEEGTNWLLICGG